MFDRQVLRKAFGYPFTDKKTVLAVMGYKDYDQVRQYFYGVPAVGRKFDTDGVIDRIFEAVTYNDTEDRMGLQYI